MDPSAPGLPVERIERRIFALRGRRLILDADLAAVYGVSTTRLNQQVRRNPRRFPPDFAFLLTEAEAANLKLRSVRSSSGWGGRRKPPLAFTEHGAVMAAAVLNTPVAVAASIAVVRAFVRLREILASHAHLLRRLGDLERKCTGHDRKLEALFRAVRELMASPKSPERTERIGFRSRGTRGGGKRRTPPHGA